MKTRKLYYEDSLLSRFTARVLSCTETAKGFEVILDATAFYPEGGGQDADTGTLGSVRVLDTRERGEAVVHLCADALAPGSEVEGVVDFSARFDRMQQHTGEHILSGILHRRYGCHNTGFHMGSELVTVDFDCVIPPEALPDIEWEVNQAIWQNIPVRCWYPSPEELPALTYRAKRALPWPVRIVEIPGYDSCACCGTHLSATGAVGLVKLVSSIGFRGGSRLEMASGMRALALLNTTFEQNRQVSQAFSAQISETGAAARKMNQRMAQQQYRIAGLEKQLFQSIAENYVNCENVLHLHSGLHSGGVRELADAIAERCGGTAAVFSGDDDAGYSYCLAARQGDLRQLGREMTQALMGRGGGKPNFQQGRVSAGRAQIEAFFHSRNW